MLQTREGQHREIRGAIDTISTKHLFRFAGKRRAVADAPEEHEQFFD